MFSKGFLKGTGSRDRIQIFRQITVLGGPPISIIFHAFPLTAGKMTNAIARHEECLRKPKTIVEVLS
jgi:alpha/beta superfamily hydrolase